MSNQEVTPRIIISKCLTFAPCRYDGSQVNDQFLQELKEYVDCIPVCPEEEIGLDTPRDPLRLVKYDGEKKLMQPSTERDLTAPMNEFARQFFSEQPEVDGFIFKNRSPSCGSRDSKIYPEMDSNVPTDTDSGLFAEQAQEYVPRAAVINEGRLKNFRLREDFLTRLFTLARFRQVKQKNDMGQLVQFQAENKYLLLAYNEQEMRQLGRIAANPEGEPINEVLTNYEHHLLQALASKSSLTANINVLMHAFGYFSDHLSAAEKEYFLETIEQYRQKQVPLSVPNGILQSWIIKYDIDYLEQQTFFSPYPEELIKITDSGKGREI